MDTYQQESVKKPTVSVCMVTYNRADLIGAAIASVQKQRYQDWEMIIVDDASTDDTEQIVAGFKDNRIHYYKNTVNQDVGRARNTALSYVRGVFVAVIDSDDIWLDPEKLGKQVRYLEQKPEVALVGTRVVTIDKDGEGLEHLKNPISDKDVRATMLKKNPFVHSSVMFRTQQVLDLGGYDNKLTTAEDYELFLRLGRIGKLVNLPRYMVGYRIHQGNIIVARRANAMKGVLSIIQKFKKDYPNFYIAWVRRLVRYVAYRVLSGLRLMK